MEITIHQMLHGYEDGHNYIRGSIYLSSAKDMDTIASLSDWSEYINPKDDSSYLSAYPLKETGYYVIARTWYAEEMRRPGCVWTHSILIPTGALRYINDYRVFETLFKRPTINEFERYSQTINLELEDTVKESHLTNFKNTDGLPRIIRNLITGEDVSIIEVESDSETYRYLCLMLMNQLPSKILQNRSFCSGTNGLRALDGKPFDLQFTIMQNQHVRSLHSGDDGIEDGFIYSSIYVPNEVLSLGKLIRMFEDEIGYDWKKYNTFCKLISLLNSNKQSADDRYRVFEQLVNDIVETFPSTEEGNLIKAKFLSKTVTSLYVKESDFIAFVCTNNYNESISKDVIEFDERIESLSKEDKKQFISLLSILCSSNYINSWGLAMLNRINEYLGENDIQELIAERWSLYISIATLCPEILNISMWGTLTPKETSELIEVLREEKNQESFRRWDYLLDIILTNGVDIDLSFANVLLRRSYNYVNTVLNHFNHTNQVKKNENLLRACSSQISTVLDWVKNHSTINENVLRFIVDAINPSSKEVKRMDAKSWSGVLGVQTRMPMDFYVFLYVLSFNWLYDLFAMEYLHESFYPLHNSIANGILSDTHWNRISPFTETLPIWQSWDKCKRLRKTIVKRVKAVGLYEDYLQVYTLDDNLNHELVEMFK